MLTRRSFVTGTAALPLLVKPVLAELSLGDARLSTVNDGHLVLPGDFVFGSMPQGEVMSVLKRFDMTPDQVMPPCNLALYQDGTNTVLFDVGSGPDFMPSAGKLAESLDVAGISVEDVTHVVFTHAHPDHIWGLIDEFDDPMFPEATYLMGRAEWDYWWNPETVNSIGDARAAFAVGAKRRMEMIEDIVEHFDDGDEVLPGIAAVASYGHTPGHMSFEVRAGGTSAMILGDAIGNHHVAFARPDWESGSDQDGALAATTRKRLFGRILDEDMPVIGFHLPGGGIGRAEVDPDGGYRFIPEGT